jgi:hypothetical protein
MRILLALAALIGVLWVFDAYVYDGCYRYAALYQFEQAVDNFSHSANKLMTGRGG